MARLTKVYEDETIATTLTFRGKDFTLTMQPWENGSRKSKEKSLEDQVEKAFPDDEDLEDILDSVYNLGFDEDDIEESLNELNRFE